MLTDEEKRELADVAYPPCDGSGYSAAEWNAILSVVDRIADARARAARELLHKQYDDAEFCADCGKATYHNHDPGCAIEAELAKLEKKT